MLSIPPIISHLYENSFFEMAPKCFLYGSALENNYPTVGHQFTVVYCNIKEIQQ
ncbi:hypothetical protein [Candidatus Lokiarchaeum ossiferum]|uniref:hypothetical protein n=1 Tax=Candidatus Lokiarchaeum ossiferum TaxID=2951803 RepID=UPI00352D1A04